MIRTSLILLTCILSLLWVQFASADVAVDQSDERVTVTAGGELFAEYLVCSGGQPVVWPLVGPTGDSYTRSYPVGPLLPGEENDHPHHQSLWFAHGYVNGLDFWHETIGDSKLAIVHRGFDRVSDDGELATIVTRNDWMNGQQRVLSDKRTLQFGVAEDVRWIDFTIELIASDDDVTFGDTKEGTFAVRVAGTMKVDSGAGHILNSVGDRDDAAWGKPAAWVNYAGPVQNKPVGITIVSHPNSFRHPCRWHVRPYGLFAANPFGEAEFDPAERKQGAVTIPHGESRLLRYRVILHAGDFTQADIDRLCDRYVAKFDETQSRTR